MSELKKYGFQDVQGSCEIDLPALEPPKPVMQITVKLDSALHAYLMKWAGNRHLGRLGSVSVNRRKFVEVLPLSCILNFERGESVWDLEYAGEVTAQLTKEQVESMPRADWFDRYRCPLCKRRLVAYSSRGGEFNDHAHTLDYALLHPGDAVCENAGSVALVGDQLYSEEIEQGEFYPLDATKK